MERPGADSEEKREPVGDIDIAVVDSLKVLDPNRPIREADMPVGRLCANGRHRSIISSARVRSCGCIVRPSFLAVLRLTTSSNLVGSWTGLVVLESGSLDELA